MRCPFFYGLFLGTMKQTRNERIGRKELFLGTNVENINSINSIDYIFAQN